MPQQMPTQQSMAQSKTHGPVYAGTLHWNEDPRSVPTPLSGGHPPQNNYQSKEPKGQNPMYPIPPFNKNDPEYAQMLNQMW